MVLSLTCLLTAIGCAKRSTQERPGPGGTGGAAGSGGQGGDGGAAPAPCPIAGTWQMTSIACGTIDQSASWFMLVPNTKLTVTALPEGGCQTIVTSQSAACREVVLETIVPSTTKPGWQVTSQGITECFPEACRFGVAENDAGVVVDAGGTTDGGGAGSTDATGADDGGADAGGTDGPPDDLRAPDALLPAPAGDAPCKLGDRAGARAPDSIVVTGDLFTATAPTASGLCRPYGLPQVTVWQRKD